jgi:C4-dicarboxylate transporter, DctM subunit
VGRLFLAGFAPGILMGLALMVAVYFISIRRSYPREDRAGLKEIALSLKGAILPLGTPIIIIGGILSGFFTPTEASVVASLYALLLGLVVYREIKIRDLPGILWDTLVHTIRVMFIISAAGFFSWLMIHQRIPDQAIIAMTSLSAHPAVFLAVAVFILLILGCFIEGIAVFLITMPILMPLVHHFGVDPIQFGVVMTLASMLGLLTPPVGMCLYAVSSISKVSIGDLSKEVAPYLIGIFAVLMAVTYIPVISTWLPSLLG